MTKPMVAYLHHYKPDEQQSKVQLIENTIQDGLRKNFVTEFVPPFIDGKVYSFPIRTALCIPAAQTTNFTLFDNCNIAFFYEKAIGLDNQGISTDIKWDDAHARERQLFIRELLLIVKAAILQKGGQLQKTKLIWFKPLSFNRGRAHDYEQLWIDEGREILHIADENNIRCVSESEAPYYYFNKKSTFKSVNSVAIVDIGGGSCDFMYFADGTPQIANSVQFGCDVLWGNGSNDFNNAQENGIFLQARDAIHFKNHDELEALNNRMTHNKLATTKEILNFWVSNQQYCDINSFLKEHFRPLFLYHFTAIVYYMAKMYHTRQLAYPKSILFCGNGSHYIDTLLTNKSMVAECTTDIFRRVYGKEIEPIQVILPEARKECTCYGGLYRPSEAIKPQMYNFQGDGDSLYQDVASLKERFNDIKGQIVASLNELNAIYEEQLNFFLRQGELCGIDNEAIMKTISSGLADSLEKNFKNAIKRLNDKETYNDSLFFLPIIDKVFELTKL
jgi:hypothetical protein